MAIVRALDADRGGRRAAVAGPLRVRAAARRQRRRRGVRLRGDEPAPSGRPQPRPGRPDGALPRLVVAAEPPLRRRRLRRRQLRQHGAAHRLQVRRSLVHSFKEPER